MEISPAVGVEEHNRMHRDWRRDILRRLVEKTEASGAADPLFRHIVKSALAEAKSASEVRVAQGQYVAKVAPTVVSSPVSNPSPGTLRPRGPRESNPTGGSTQPTVYGKDEKEQIRRALDEVEKRIADTARLCEKLVTAHLQCSPSLISERQEYGERLVKRADGSVFRVCETRSEALKAIEALLDLERATPDEPDDDEGAPDLKPPLTPSAPKPNFAKPEDSEITPGVADPSPHGGRLDGRRIPARKTVRKIITRTRLL